ncbi:MAG: hypothetical protein WC238_06145 [Parcubacteria group bacterium]|jgi:hypothetical protein
MKIELKQGQRFGKLTVIGEGERFIQPSGQGQRGIICQCDCGNIKTIRLSQLIRLRIKSCGCIIPPRKYYHKRLYSIWRGMVNRCHGEKTVQPHLYKDKGITVCDEWRHSYNTFAEWASDVWKEGLTIDRIDGSKGYNPQNCRFVTQLENNLNRINTVFVEYQGSRVSLFSLLDDYGLLSHLSAIRARLKRGYSIEEAINKPIRKYE